MNVKSAFGEHLIVLSLALIVCRLPLIQDFTK